MQDRLMQEIEELAKDTAYQVAKVESEQRARETEIASQFEDNREGRRAAKRAMRKRNGYTR